MKFAVAALLFAPVVAAGKYDRNVEVSVQDSPMASIEAINLGGTVETELRDGLTVGGKYEQCEAKFKPRSLFAKWSSGSNPLKLKTSYNVVANSAEVDLEWESRGTTLELEVDTARPRWLRKVGVSRGASASGRDLTLSPSYDFASQVAALKTRLSLNADTDVELELESNDLGSRSALDATLTIEHAINEKNSLKPVFALNTGDVTYEYTRKLSADAELVAHVNPGNEVNVKWEDAGSHGMWTTNFKMPWGNAKGSSVSVKRNFNL